MSTPPDQPKKKRVPKRLSSKEEIINQIDKFTKKRDEKHRQAAQLLQDAKELRMMANQTGCRMTVSLLVEADVKYDEAQNLGKAIKRLEEKVLPAWKQKLAEFQTEVIPGFLPDKSVGGI